MLTGSPGLAAAVCVVAAVLLVLAVARPRPGGGPGCRGATVVPVGVLGLVGAGVAVLAVSGPRLGLPAGRGTPLVGATVLAVGLGALVAASRRRRRSEQQHARTQAQVLGAVEQMAADLTVGQTPRQVLAVAQQHCPVLAEAARAAELGGEVPASLRTAAREPGAGDLRHVAAAWQVAQRSGDGLARALDHTARTLRESHRTRRVVASELASARATARLVALLPLATWAMGSASGGAPLTFLLGTPLGIGCLVVGLGLGGTGLWWIDQLGRRAARSAGLEGAR